MEKYLTTIVDRSDTVYAFHILLVFSLISRDSLANSLAFSGTSVVVTGGPEQYEANQVKLAELGLSLDDEDARDIRDQIEHWQATKRNVDAVIDQADGR